MYYKKIIIRFFLFLSASFFLVETAFAEKVGQIQFVGNEKTSSNILLSVISIHPGDNIKDADINESVQLLKNTTVFEYVSASKEKSKSNDNEIDLTFHVIEKWTIVPYISVGSGGGSSYADLGVLDTNFLGRLYKGGVQAGVQNNSPNFAATFENDYTFAQPLITGTIASFSDNYYTYYSPTSTDKTSYLFYRMTSVNPYALWKLTDTFQLGGGLLYTSAQEINNGLSNSDKNFNKNAHIKDPNSYSSTAAEGIVRVGIINYEDLSQEGVQLQSIYNTTGGMYNSDDNDYAESLNTLTAYFRFPRNSNSYFATRLGFEETNSDNLIRQYRLGGLSTLRGFYDGQFVGKDAIYSNTEYRATVWKGNYVAIQPAPFFDYGSAANNLNELFNHKQAASVGFGVRVPLIKVNSIVFRLDYAWAISPFVTSGMSAGITQFF